MFKLLGGLLMLVPLSLAAAQSSPGDWKEFVSKQCGFVVQMPGMPEEHQQSVKTSIGTIYVSLTVLEFKKDERGYVVAYSELPESAIKSDTEEKRLDNAREGAINSVRGKLKSEKQIKLEDNPGRELLIQVNAKTMVRARLYSVKNRLYQVMAVGSPEQVNSKDAVKFLESFKLLK